jgi:hypothetical protein
MPVRRDARTENWFFRTIIKSPDGKLRVYGTPGIPGPYHDLPQTKDGALEAEQRAIRCALASRAKCLDHQELMIAAITTTIRLAINVAGRDPKQMRELESELIAAIEGKKATP